MLSSAATSVFDESFPDLNWGFVTGLEDKKAATFGAVDHLSLMSSAKNKELAYKLIQHMLSVESMTEFHKAIPRAPITKVNHIKVMKDSKKWWKMTKMYIDH